MKIRPASAADQEGIVSLIDRVFGEYGDKVFLRGADADLLDIQSHYVGAGGAFVVLDDDTNIRGTHAALPLDEEARVCTFRRLYLDRELRGTRWGGDLMHWAVDWARQQGFDRIEFWSDTRFERAHRFFERHSFVRDGRIREMDDGAMPYREHFFFRDLT